MRRLWDGLGLLLATALGMAGCAAPDITLRPPKHPEEITVPPLEDTKYSNPPKYPEGTLNQEASANSPNGPGGAGGPPGAGGMGGRGGMGGGGGMGGMGGGGMGGAGGGYGGRGY